MLSESQQWDRIIGEEDIKNYPEKDGYVVSDQATQRISGSGNRVWGYIAGGHICRNPCIVGKQNPVKKVTGDVKSLIEEIESRKSQGMLSKGLAIAEGIDLIGACIGDEFQKAMKA